VRHNERRLKRRPGGGLRALETGVMRDIGAKLTSGERPALAAYPGKAEAKKAISSPTTALHHRRVRIQRPRPVGMGSGLGLDNW